ncbi:DUF2304 domain-containing protein [Microbacterium stercoris]|uniref:DUF2304 domain-containing protein n=1 Tax=Microbacterium stercoris TaxID=2820289 RepID=A0A939QTN3_9MICO|nr:DUF2304 domain-containing protein [Microbacterium stercoris]MBO3664973.1 DUF2304 domain-containing protein [Microbacterium stercoris]
MSTISYVFGIVAAILVLVLVFEMLRRSALRERHAVWWTVGAVLALVAAVFPQTLFWASDLLGIEVPFNMVVFIAVGLLFLVGLQQATELTQIEDRARTLAERVATIELRLRELEQRESEIPDEPGPVRREDADE